MSKKEASKSTSQINPDRLKDLQSMADETADSVNPKRAVNKENEFHARMKTVTGIQYEVEMSIAVKKIETKMVPPENRIVMSEKVVDKLNQIFKAGTMTISIQESMSMEPAEAMQGIDAEDVEIILKLFGLAKNEDINETTVEE